MEVGNRRRGDDVRGVRGEEGEVGSGDGDRSGRKVGSVLVDGGGSSPASSSFVAGGT